MEARNRTLADWYRKILRGEIRLSRFQCPVQLCTTPIRAEALTWKTMCYMTRREDQKVGEQNSV